MKCAWASIDERWKASGGRAGDQTGNEFKVGDWYYFGQNAILRPKEKHVAYAIASAMKHFATCNLVGYDQLERTTLYDMMEFIGWDFRKLDSRVEADCSSAVAVAVRCAGIKVNKNIYTGNMKKALLDTGAFEALTGSKYIYSSDWLKNGDIILNEKKHVIVAIENGGKVHRKPYTGELPGDTVNKHYGEKSDIEKWQKFLCWFGADVAIDGSFGPDTASKTVIFQKKNGLEQDGSCGPITRKTARQYIKED